MKTLGKNCLIKRVAPDSGAATTFIVAAGTSDFRSTGVRTRGFKRICWILLIGTMAASSSVDVKAQQSSDDAVADGYSDLAGSATAQVTATDDNKIVIVDYEVEKDYQALYCARGDGGNATIDGLIAILYNGDGPITVDATVLAQEVHGRLTEGTA